MLVLDGDHRVGELGRRWQHAEGVVTGSEDPMYSSFGVTHSGEAEEIAEAGESDGENCRDTDEGEALQVSAQSDASSLFYVSTLHQRGVVESSARGGRSSGVEVGSGVAIRESTIRSHRGDSNRCAALLSTSCEYSACVHPGCLMIQGKIAPENDVFMSP